MKILSLIFILIAGGKVFGQIPKIAFNMNATVQKPFAANGPRAEFSKQKISVNFNLKETKDCQITAQLFVCDDKETYCVPKKQNYNCQGNQVTGEQGQVSE